MRSYTILLPNEKAKTYRYVTLFILLVNCLVFGFVYFHATGERMSTTSLWGTILSFTSLVLFIIHFFTGKLSSYRPGISFIILSIFWFMLGNYLLGIFILFFAVTGFYAGKKFNVVFTESGITYPSFPEKKYGWNEVSNVMLKDNVLTIDLKNNKLIQAVIEKGSAGQVNENDFNEFCAKCLAGV